MSVAFHAPPRRILVRGVNWLGNAVMTTPALLRLREQFPAAHIALFGPDKLDALWRHHPAVDDTIFFAAGQNVFSIGKRLRQVGSSRCDDRTAQRAVPTIIPPRVPPIRFRKSVPDCWIGLELVEGKNRQVRRMTAAIGYPTLRLLRVRIGGLKLGELAAGKWKILLDTERKLVVSD